MKLKRLFLRFDSWFSRRWGWFFINGFKEESKKEEAKPDTEQPKPKDNNPLFVASGRNSRLGKRPKM